MFIVVSTDYGDTCDGHSRLVGKYETKDEAEAEVRADMAAVRQYLGKEAAVDEAKHEVWACEADIGSLGTVWDIHEV